MALCDKAITVRAMAPSKAHIKAYLMIEHQNPLQREGEPSTPPKQTPPSGGTLHHLQVELGDLDDHELQQLVEELRQEIALHDGNAPPSSPPPNPWVYPLGSRNPEEDD